MTIQEILEKLGVEYVSGGHRHSRPGWINLDCPWCGKGTKKFHLGYNLRLGYFSCWKCRGKHPVGVLLRLGLDRPTAEDFFRSRSIDPEALKERIRKGLVEPSGRGPLAKQHRDYLRGRGFDPKELVRIWQLEGIKIHSRLSWRVYIPIIYKQERVSWTTRSISPEAPQRYISASAEEEAVNHKHLVYGLDYCLHSIVIVEGPADAWRIGPGAGALLGTAFSSAQVKKLIQIPHRFICFDRSRDAQKVARKLAEQLSLFPGSTTVLEIDAADPGTASKKEVDLIRKIARLS